MHIVSQSKENSSISCLEAKSALEIYGGMDASLKAKFLNDFIVTGRGKEKDSLKSRYACQRTAERTKEEKNSATSN